MSLSLFDIVGPVMVGPSSSHTAGAARIGFLAGKIAGIAAEQATLYFHPVLMQTYAGHRTHAALIGGLLGYREDDLRLKTALQEAAQRGLTFDVKQVERSGGGAQRLDAGRAKAISGRTPGIAALGQDPCTASSGAKLMATDPKRSVSPNSLLSGYKSNRINWLPISYKSLPQSDV